MSEFNLGDEVFVSREAPSEWRPGSKAWVVGLAVPDRDFVTIEFEDGSSLELSPTLVSQQTA